MALYMVVALGVSAPLVDAAIQQKFDLNCFRIDPGRWFISSTLQTAKDVSDTIGITTDVPGGVTIMTGIVVSVKGYFGRGPNNMWEWVAANYS